MEYTIGELAKKMHLTTHTLRYYDDEGLLRNVKRAPNGRRVFTERDVVMLNTIECLKRAGMSIQDIRQYIDWCDEGFSSVQKRYELFARKEADVLAQMEELKKVLATVQWKKKFYKQCLDDGEIRFCDEDRLKMAEIILRGEKLE